MSPIRPDGSGPAVISAQPRPSWGVERHDPDPAAIRAAQDGDLDAFEAIMLAIDQEVRRFVASRADSAELVEEIVQAAFVTAFERIGDWQPTGRFTSWVVGIAHNHLRDEQRRRRRLMSDGDVLDRVLMAARAGLDEEPDPRLDRLDDCLQRLTPQARALVTARYGEGLSLDDLAARLSAEANTIAVRLHRIRASLRACVEGGP